MNTGTIIGNIFLVYLVAQLLSTAYGLTVIGTLDPIIDEKLKDKGYMQKKKNSLYEFNDKFTAIIYGFIPFYYAIKAVNLVTGEKPLDRAVDEKIVSGEYLTADEQKKIFEKTELEKNDESLFIPQSTIQFEKPEPYKARTVDNSLYDTYETPIEYATREMDKDDVLSITPFAKEEVPTIPVQEVTTKDVARHIAELSTQELIRLRDKLNDLIEISKKDNYQIVLEKDK